MYCKLIPILGFYLTPSGQLGIYYFSGDSIVSYKEDNNSNIHFGTFSDLEKLQNKQYEYILNELENDSQD